MNKLKSSIPFHFMLFPSVVLVLIFSYVPMFGIVIAFQDFQLGHLFDSPWVGLDNFRYVMSLPNFGQVLFNTMYIAVFKIIGMIIVPITFSLLLNEVTKMKFKSIFQTMIYIPNFLSWIIMGGILIDILSPSEGIVNKILSAIGLEPIFFLGDESWFPITMILSDIWKSFGFGTVIYLAALTSIDPTQYESALIDGANRWKQTLYITLPGIMPIIVLMTVLSLGNVLNAGFDQIVNLYSPAVLHTGDIIDTYVYRLGFGETQYAPAAAIGLFKSLISFVLISASYILADKVANYRIF